MAIASRSVKQGGGTTLADGQTAAAADVETDMATLFALVNGNLDKANLAANSVGNSEVDTSDKIDPEKIDDHSSTDAESVSTDNPGVTGSFNAAGDLREEIQQLRYVVQRLALGINAKLEDATDSAAWLDLPAVGVNLVTNGHFADEVLSNAVVGWTTETNVTLTMATSTEITEGTGNELNVAVSGGTNAGITQTFSGLKASTKYLAICRVKPNTGTCKLITTGAIGSGSFENLNLTSGDGTAVFETLSGCFSTDATPTDIVLGIRPQADGDDCDVRGVWLFECNEDPLRGFVKPLVVNYHATPGTTLVNGAGAVQVGDIRAVTIPSPGCSLVSMFSARGDSQSLGVNHQMTTIMQFRIDGGAWTSTADLRNSAPTDTFDISNSGQWGIANPASGSVYEFRLTGQASNGDVDVDTVQMTIILLP